MTNATNNFINIFQQLVTDLKARYKIDTWQYVYRFNYLTKIKYMIEKCNKLRNLTKKFNKETLLENLAYYMDKYGNRLMLKKR